VLAETGRQPWVIDGVLPTFMGVSSLSASQVILTMVGFTLLYGTLAVIEVTLMVRAIRKGPASEKPAMTHQPASGGFPQAVPAPLYDR